MDAYIWYAEGIFSAEEWEEKKDYSEEEMEAMQNPERMTQALFEKCLGTSVRLDDFDCYFRLIDEFPAFSDEYNRKVELLIRYGAEPPVPLVALFGFCGDGPCQKTGPLPLPHGRGSGPAPRDTPLIIADIPVFCQLLFSLFP